MPKKRKQKSSLIKKMGLSDRYNLSFLLTSIVPLIILTAVVLLYVRPALESSEGHELISLNIMLFFVIFLTILGFFVSRSATQESIEKLSANNQHLQHMFDISQSLNKEVHLDVLLEDIVKAAMKMTNASGGIVLLLSDDRSELKFAVNLGTGEKIMNSIPNGKGVGGWVAKNQKMVILNNIENSEQYDRNMDVFPNFDTSAILAVPLGIQEKPFGVLELLHRDENELFSEEDGRLVKILAEQATIFIENAQYHADQKNYFIHITELLLNALEGTRQFWPNHLRNTARYANIIARGLNFPDGKMRDLHYAALLHDIGFIKINLREDPSRSKIELHPELGYEMIKDITLWHNVAPIIRYHHERFDGDGYPHKLAGEEIPLSSRILAVSETLDVLTNKYSYRKNKMDMKAAMKEIRAYSGTQFDPQIVDELQKVIDSNVIH